MNNAAQRAANRRYKNSDKGRMARRRREQFGVVRISTERSEKASAAATRQRRAAAAEFLRSKKEGIPCADCGGVFPSCCMDFDHRDPSSKVWGIAQMLTCSIAAIEEEMAKCDLVCANCHRIRTFTRNDHLRKSEPKTNTPQMSLSIEHHDSIHSASEREGSGVKGAA